MARLCRDDTGAFFYIRKGAFEMDVVTEPKVEMTAADAQVAEEQVQEEEKFDQARAMETIRKLREAEKAGKKAEKELADLKKAEQLRQEAEMSELQKAQKRADDLQAALAAREHEALQRKVADAVGLPALLADRLRGKDEDEMTADATKLLETLPKPDAVKKTNPNINPTNPAGASQFETDAQKKVRLGLIKGFDLFSQSTNESLGGGVLQLGDKGE